MRPLAIIGLCCLVAACDYRCGPATGTVLEVENFEAPPEDWKFKPIQGAEIVVYWEGVKPAGPDSGRAYCLASVNTTSDAQGKFFVQGLKVPRAVSEIKNIATVSLAYVPGFVALRPHEHSHPIFARSSVEGSSVHVFRRAQDPSRSDLREDVFYTAKSCPSDEFLEAGKR